MLIEMWPALQFDPAGTNPVNDIKDEVQKLSDKQCPWIVPNGAPFKAGSVKIKDASGQSIKTGWKEVFKPMPLIEMTGLDINTFIELDDVLLQSYDELTISYHSVGASFIPRSSLEDQLDAISHGSEPIPWSKVIQIPPTLPSSYHWHSKEELMDWSELVLYVKYLVGVYQNKVSKSQTITQIFALVDTTLKNLIAKYNLVNTNLINHGRNSGNPHKVTAAMLLLQNIDNFATATVAQDVLGTTTNLFSTSAGALAAIKAAVPDTSGLLNNGLLPISSLTADDYLPPVIDGSFEGLGTDNNCAAMCLENNGRLVSVKRHYDGRVKGLYFSFIDDYKDATKPYYFTGFKYANAALTAQGYALDTVMLGSGPGVMVAGDSVKGKWFGALTNGTLNPDTHNYKEFDLSNIPGASLTDPTFCHCFKTKTYIYIVSQPDDLKVYFYRALVSDLTTKTVVTFTAVPVTFKDLTGNQYTNSAYWIPDATVTDAQGHITRFINTITPYATDIVRRYNAAIFFAEESPDVMLMKVVHRPLYRNADLNWFQYVSFEMTIRINCISGAITIAAQQPINALNANDGLSGSSKFVLSDFAANVAGYNWGPYGGIVTRTGDLLVLRDNGDHVYVPTGFIGLKGGNTTAADALLKSTANATLAANNWTSFNIAIKTPAPLQIGGGSNVPANDIDGEWIPGLDINAQNSIMGFRKVTGAFALRAGITNIKLSNMKARPLVNTVYRSNLHNGQLFNAYSGTAAELAAAGVEMGVTTLSGMGLLLVNGAWNNVSRQVGNMATVLDNYYVCPRSVTKTFKDDDMTLNVVANNYYGMTASVLNQIKSMVQSDGSTATVMGLRVSIPQRDISNAGLSANQPMFVNVHWYSPSSPSTIRLQVLAINFTVGAPVNGVYPITAPVFLDASTILTMGGGDTASPSFYVQVGGTTGHFQSYKNGNVITVKGSSGLLGKVSGGSTAFYPDYDYNLSTNKFTRSVVTSGSYTPSGSIAMIPKVGFAALYDQTYTGQACCIANTTDGPYLLSSCYPDSGWIIYFKAGTKLVINGTQYDAPTGTVDLRDIDPSPGNKTFYVYATCYGDKAYFIVSGKKIRHNLSLIPAAEVITNALQILLINRKSTFMIGDAILSTARIAGSVPVSIGLPMDAGVLDYIYQSDLPTGSNL